jgi:hypothetical protein
MAYQLSLISQATTPNKSMVDGRITTVCILDKENDVWQAVEQRFRSKGIVELPQYVGHNGSIDHR